MFRSLLPRCRRGSLALALLLGLGLLPAVAGAQFVPLLPEAEEGTTSGSILGGSSLGMTGVPTSFVLGHAYNYSLTGPLHLDLGAFVGLYESLLVLRGVPGVKYDLHLASLPFVPYGKAGLAVDLLTGDAAGEQTLAVGVRLAAGLRQFFDRQLALGVALAPPFGLSAGDQRQGAVGLEGLVSFEYHLD